MKIRVDTTEIDEAIRKLDALLEKMNVVKTVIEKEGAGFVCNIQNQQEVDKCAMYKYLKSTLEKETAAISVEC